MNHDAIATSLCGHYTRLSDTSGYLESIFSTVGDGSLLGAYIVQDGPNVIVTDDGDTLFNAIASGVDVHSSRAKAYRKLAEVNGLHVGAKGEMYMASDVENLPAALASYFRATLAVTDLAYKHRPGDKERFMRTVADELSVYGKRLSSRPEMIGLSGHQLSFHFGLDVGRDNATMIQTIAATDGTLKWSDVYQTGGKFKDARAAQSHLRLVAVLEGADDVEKASSFLSDIADVYVYTGEPLRLAA